MKIIKWAPIIIYAAIYICISYLKYEWVDFLCEIQISVINLLYLFITNLNSMAVIIHWLVLNWIYCA